MTKEAYKTGADYAASQDAIDPLKKYRNDFHLPKSKSGEDIVYFTGNSLGLQPKTAKKFVDQEMSDWANLGVKGHVKGHTPWIKYHELLTENMAKIVGAKPIEVVVMNTLTANLHFLMASFYKPTASRYKILIESDAFPSDKFAVESQLRHHGFDHKNGLVFWSPRANEELLHYDDLERILEQQGSEIALILIGSVNYYTGQFFDLKRISSLGHKYGCIVGFDCAHGAGNIRLDLHDSGCDFAAWCNYKYLNSGPGSIASAFVHEKHAHDRSLNRLAGWWGHNKEKRFNMRDEFDPIPGAEGWQLSNPPVLSMAPILASLDIFSEVGMDALLEKSKLLTGYLEFLISGLGENKVRIITPKNQFERGCQLSIQVKHADKTVFNKLTALDVITDWREPDVIRCAPVPLYNSFTDIYTMVERLKRII